MSLLDRFRAHPCPKCGCMIDQSTGQKRPDGNVEFRCPKCGVRLVEIEETTEHKLNKTSFGIVGLFALALSLVMVFGHPELISGTDLIGLVWSFITDIFIYAMFVCLVGFWIVDYLFR